MKRKFLMFLVLMSTATAVAAGDEAAKKEAANRYGEDRKICADEPDSSQRMQCLRDAKEEYKKALAAAQNQPAAANKPAGLAAPCNDCGKVLAVNVTEKEGDAGPVGLIAGGVAGALLGNQVGRGTGRSVATVAGAAGGAYAGHKIEGKMKATKNWAVSVRFDNGDERGFNFDHDPGLIAGDAVKAAGGSIVRR